LARTTGVSELELAGVTGLTVNRSPVSRNQ